MTEARHRDDEELEEPAIVELLGLEETPRRVLASRVAGSIQRRETAAQMVTLVWSGFGSVLLEALRVSVPTTKSSEISRSRRS